MTTALYRLEQGDTSNLKAVGGGVSELPFDVGPGCRVYFGQVGDALIIQLGGGTNKGQQRDIASARRCWADYKRRNRNTR